MYSQKRKIYLISFDILRAMRTNWQERGENMELRFRKATRDEIDLVVSTRMEVLDSVSQGYGEALHPAIEKETRKYFERELGKGYQAYFVYQQEEFVGCGGICFTQIVPTVENHTGKAAVIVNMYTRPAWRGKGIAYRLLDVLVQEAMARGVSEISLESTPQGAALYKRYGFVENKEAMLLPYHRLKEQPKEDQE